MKKIFLLSTLLMMTIAGYSQFNYKFNYQAVVRNGAGALVANGSTVNFRLSILESSATGTVLYSETQSKVVNNNQGLVSLVIGAGTPAVTGDILFSGNFQDLSKEKFLKVEVDPTGGSSFTDMGATQLQFVPYAAHAFTATIAENGTQWGGAPGSDISYTSGKVNVGSASPTGAGIMNIEKSIAGAGTVLNVRQTNPATPGVNIALEVLNKSAGYNFGIKSVQEGTGWGVYGATTGSGIGVEGYSLGTAGYGMYAHGAVGMSARSTATNGVAIDLDGFLKVNGTKTAFKTPALVSAAGIVTITYGGAASTDMIFVTPISGGFVMPSWQVLWNTSTSVWQIWNASDDGTPSNFPAGTSFNILVIKQ